MLLLDTSGSQRVEWERIRREASRFLRDTLRPGDRVFIITFARSVRVAIDITTPSDDENNFARRLNRLTPASGGEVSPPRDVEGGTRLWDAAMFATRALATVKGRKAVLIFTDALDNASEIRPAQVSYTAQNGSVPIYGIGVPNAILVRSNPRFGAKQLAEFSQVVTDSGGTVFVDSRDEAVAGELEQIAARLRSQFVVEYYSPPDTAHGIHQLRVQAVDRSVEVHSKASVWR